MSQNYHDITDKPGTEMVLNDMIIWIP